MILNKEEIRDLIDQKDLIQYYIHLDTQLTPNGFDLTVKSIEKFEESGKLDFSNSEREIPESKPIKPTKKGPSDKYGWWVLDPGVYKIRTNEIVNLPLNLVGIAFPRSSLLRMGAYVNMATWDAGFKGRSEFLLKVENSSGIEIKENARICQIIFIRTKEVREGYKGTYKNME